MSAARTTPLVLDAPACDGCGRCVRACRPKALKVGAGYIYVDWERCDACGRCAEACDRGAIELRRSSKDASTASGGKKAASAAPGGTRAAKAAATADAAEPLAWLPAAFRRGGAAALSGGPAAPVARPRKPAAPSGAVPAATGAPWSVAEAALVLVVAFALLVGIQVLGPGVAGPGLTTVGYDIVLAAVLGFLALRRGGGLLAAFRLDRAPELGSVALAVGLGIGCWGFSIAYRVSALALGFAPPAGDGSNLATLFGPGVFGAIATVVVIGVLGPLVEEAALRGVVAQGARRRFGVGAAVIGTAVLFAALHASVWSFIPLTVLGLALGWLAMRSRSLWPAVIAHVLYNAVFVASALYVVVSRG